MKKTILSIKLPEAYCVACSKERPEEFAFIRAAEERGSIIFTGFCPRHALEVFGSHPSIKNARIENGELLAEIGSRTFHNDELLPESGVLWRSECL